MNKKVEHNWYQEEIRKPEHIQRINNVCNINNYLLRRHKVLERPDFQFKEKNFTSAKIVLQTLKTIITFHASYTVGNPVSLTGDKEFVDLMERVYKKGQFTKQDYEIISQLIKYGNAWEYIYLKDNIIRSKVFLNEDCYPCFDERGSLYAFIEYWRDAASSTEYHTIYYNDRVESYTDNELVRQSANLTGLPIHYKSMNLAEDTCFGEPFVNDLIPVMDQIEHLLSKIDDAVTTLSLNPVAWTTGRMPDEPINSNLVGACLRLDEGGTFQYANAEMDYSNIKLELDSLLQQFYGIACVPSSVLGQSNVANVSEVSLAMLFNCTDNVARQNMYSLKEGFAFRWQCIRKLMELQGTEIPDEWFDSLDCSFNVNRPVDTQSAMEEMKMQWDMGAISKQTIIENSKHTTNTALELDRLKTEEDTAEAIRIDIGNSERGKTDDNLIKPDLEK